MTRYAELAVTTNFSFLRGASHPAEMVAAAEELGLSAIAITDRNSFAGLTYKSFAQIDRRLAELGALLTQVERAEIAARRNEVLFFGALAVAAIALASRFVF